MNVAELQQRLEAECVRASAYCLTGGLPSEAYTLEYCEGQWRVYYSERGERSGLLTFDSESAACGELLQQVLADWSTRYHGE